MRHPHPNLHIEWSPNRVRAIHTGTNQGRTGDSLADLKGFFAGQSEAIIGIDRSRVFLKSLLLPKASPEDLRRILSVQVGQIFPLPADQLAFDFFQTTEQTAEGFVTVVAAIRATDIRQLRSELQAIGIRPVRILPVALGSAVVAERAGLASALVVERAEAGLMLDVVQEGVVRFSRIAPRGSDTSCEAQRTIASAGVNSLPLLSVNGQVLEGAKVTPETVLGVLHEVPAFTFELAEDREQERKKQVASRTRLAALMFVSSLLFVALVWADRSDALAVIKKGEGVWAKELGKVRSIRDLEATRASRITGVQMALKRAFEPAQPLSDLATVVGDSLPTGAWLTGLSIERGKPLQIRGTARTAEDVARFVDTLGLSPRFRDVKLVFANSAKVEETPIVQFSITATAIGNLPLPQAEKKKGATRRTSGKPPASASTEGAGSGGSGEDATKQ
jgi:Tfp pilus assembly protein PilN